MHALQLNLHVFSLQAVVDLQIDWPDEPPVVAVALFFRLVLRQQQAEVLPALVLLPPVVVHASMAVALKVALCVQELAQEVVLDSVVGLGQ